MTLPPLYVAFEQHQVEVITAIPDVHATLTRWFAAMLSAQPICIVKQVQITAIADGYRMQAGETVDETIRGELWLLQAVKYEIVMGLMAARSDLLWFHAGAVADDAGAILFAGPGGSGKSTLVAHLYQQGWQYLSDDVMPLDLATGKILPFPQTPRVRQNTGELVPSDRLGEVPKFEVRLERDRVCREAVGVRAIVFAQYDPAISTQLSPCSPGTTALELLRNCINFLDHKQIALEQVGKLVKQSSGVQLEFSDAKVAVDCLNDQLNSVLLRHLL
jgi:hypothetical protein